MVKKSFLLTLLFLLSLQLYAETEQSSEKSIISVVQRLLEPRDFRQHQRLIKRIFKDKNRYTDSSGNISTIKVVERLKSNGILKLFFKSPQELQITFQSNGYPLFFIKLLSDSLRSMGYHRYSIVEAKHDIDGFYWTISMKSEYMIDPTVLQNTLQKRKSSIVDIERESPTKWKYIIEIEHAQLDVKKVKLREELTLKKPVVDYWLNVEDGKEIKIESINDNNWYPYITLYDRELHILKRIKRDKRTKYINFKLPKHTKYVKISDIYQLNNLKNGIKVVTE